MQRNSHKGSRVIYDRLKKLDNNTRYPYHMPGHKRNPMAGPLADIMAIDITEIDGFDDLHDAHGIIREAEARAARLCGAQETHFLVNGSTAGVLAAVSAACGGAATPLLCAGRGSHQSFLHGAYLMGAEVIWLREAELAEGALRVPGAVDPGAVMEVFARAADGRLPAAVFVTSPTYYGVVGDVPSIVEIAHSYGVPVIVDEAHGAHFGFGDGMPDSAVHAGADLVVQSVHKTLPSLTQTALLHAQGTLIDRGRLARFLRIYQTSSPSYVLMASIDACMEMIERRPDALFGRAARYKQIILQQAAKWKKLRIVSEVVVRDPCKVLVSTADTPMTGRDLYDILLENYSIQPEMAGADEVLLILTGMDTEDGLEALLWSLAAIDGYLADGTLTAGSAVKKPLPEAPLPEVVCGVADAWNQPSEPVALAEAAGRVCAEPVIPYPPGTPALVPGERIDDAMTARLAALRVRGLSLRGVESREGVPVVRVLAGK